jgi:hypothetical protein
MDGACRSFSDRGENLMKKKTLHFVLAAMLLASASARANDGDIRIFFEPNRCSTVIPCGEVGTMYVYAALAGATAKGITGVEYSVRIGMDGAADPGWTFEEEWVPGAVVVGSGAFNPVDIYAIQPRLYRHRGINVAWGSCQTGQDGLVLIETVTVTNTGCSSSELRLLVWSHDYPASQFFLCPLATLCDPPFTKVCLGDNVTPCGNLDFPSGWPSQCSTSSEAVINPEPNSQSACRITAVNQVSWSGVKSLYRDSSTR